MNRKMIDCRKFPGPCTLAISGQEAEVLEAQAWHLVSAHGATDGPELRDRIRAALTDVKEEVPVQ
jgi:hypothetical protein